MNLWIMHNNRNIVSATVIMLMKFGLVDCGFLTNVGFETVEKDEFSDTVS